MNWICKSCRTVTDENEWEEDACPICRMGGVNGHEVQEEKETEIIWVKN